MNYRDLAFPALLCVLSGILFASQLPFTPIDETRYVSVAWEMWLRDSWIIPLLNGDYYAHKPPLLFWLIHLDWLLFGVNGASLRFIPVVFSLLNLAVVYRLAMLLWEDRIIARYAAALLASFTVYLAWSAFVMFDVILTFWVLIGIYGIVLASRRDGYGAWLITGIAIGGGLLTKGPVIFIHLLPAALLAPLWLPRPGPSLKQWSGGLALAILCGLLILSLWLIPAVLTGDEAYRQAVLWKQTAGRVVDAFAHQRPVWWYLPVLPALLFPWVLFRPAWSRQGGRGHDPYNRLLLVWMVSVFLVFTLISAKQIHYLVPVLPAVSLWMARNIRAFRANGNLARWRYPVAAVYFVAGVVPLFLHVLADPAQHTVWSNTKTLNLGIALLLLSCVVVLVKRKSMDGLLKTIAASSLAAIAIVLSLGGFLDEGNDLRRISEYLHAQQQAGHEIVHYLKRYSGEYHFLGRLEKPLAVIYEKQALREFLEQHGDARVIIYSKQDGRLHVGEGHILLSAPYRRNRVFVLDASGAREFARL